MTTRRHVLTWEVPAGDATGWETAWVETSGSALRAHGRAFGLRPDPYWLTYELETGPEWVTRTMRVTVEAEHAVRRLELTRDEDGVWSADGEPLSGLGEALDCDLGLCPLTNTMPVLRHRLHERPGDRSLVMAWISVPDLVVRASRQHYTHLGEWPGRSRVRFASGTFRSDVTFDRDGFVVDYPQLARRVSAA
ncbi:putative glycolipid-binding domain-containing protein [Streptomyces sp. DSM 42041]|uniref:Glycolipid-binding domain-containing protein n=1 Tax=Streptomyces hazeniae TaxID=3075538 RepID=A0ABU2NRA4_9ACTN|nr:putative glycolipid-binding domain-containing protein [Streptomyces sp. DSM 42041]MDT0379505.1 putative glycolipid-binding domain-containing protein [Streptomyces sp. DSM 42041]